jgi:hypothetical protein
MKSNRYFQPHPLPHVPVISVRREVPGEHWTAPPRRSRSLARGLAWGMAFVVLFGCGVFQPAAPGPAAAVPGLPALPAPAAPAASPPFPPAPAALPSDTPAPVLTATPLPSLTPFPSLTPLPIFDVSKYTPSATAPGSSATLGRCCTLRVYNSGSVPLWIGRMVPESVSNLKPRWYGTVIKPRWYLEFYPNQPKTMTVYWCFWVNRTKVPTDVPLGAEAPGSDNLFDCRHRDVEVGPGLTELSVQ